MRSEDDNLDHAPSVEPDQDALFSPRQDFAFFKSTRCFGAESLFTQAGFCHPDNIFVFEDRFLLSVARDDHEDAHEYVGKMGFISDRLLKSDRLP